MRGHSPSTVGEWATLSTWRRVFWIRKLIGINWMVYYPGLGRCAGVTLIIVSAYLPSHHVWGSSWWLVESLWRLVRCFIGEQFIVQALTFSYWILIEVVAYSTSVLRVQGGECSWLTGISDWCESGLECAPIVRCATGSETARCRSGWPWIPTISFDHNIMWVVPLTRETRCIHHVMCTTNILVSTWHNRRLVCWLCLWNVSIICPPLVCRKCTLNMRHVITWSTGSRICNRCSTRITVVVIWSVPCTLLGQTFAFTDAKIGHPLFEKS